MYRYLLFDADGTLFDFDSAETYAFDATCREFDIQPTEHALQAYKEANRQIWREFEIGTIDIDNLQVERFARFFVSQSIDRNPVDAGKRFTDHLASAGTLYPETIPLLDELRGRGYVLSLITNGISRVQRGRLKQSDTCGYFEVVCISEEIGAQKPRKEFFDTFFELARLSEDERRNCLVIGDSLTSDIQGGNDAGIDTCWYNPQGRMGDPEIIPTYEIGLLQELLTLLPPLR
ncbi:MAG: YjjG family noncanonical pyrimidine nucleotidase [Sphaerochaetaceae bacterium]|jgi:YjjG family noncanonical pyrimidine nucleotidase